MLTKWKKNTKRLKVPIKVDFFNKRELENILKNLETGEFWRRFCTKNVNKMKFTKSAKKLKKICRARKIWLLLFLKKIKCKYSSIVSLYQLKLHNKGIEIFSFGFWPKTDKISIFLVFKRVLKLLKTLFIFYDVSMKTIWLYK